MSQTHSPSIPLQEREVTQQTFWQKTKRFFEPLLLEKLITLRTITLYSLWWSIVVVHIFFIQKIVLFLEAWDKPMFQKTMIIYIWIVIFYEVVDFLMKKWWWVENVNAYRKRIDEKYIIDFLNIENTQIEKYWTWKLVSIITKWSDVWSLLLNQFLMEFCKLFYVFIYAIIIVFQLGIVYGVIFVIIYGIIFSLSAYFNSQSLDLRRERVLEWNNYTKSFVRILMNKTEINSSWKWSYEVSRLKNHADTMTEINQRMSTSVFFCYRVWESSIIWLKIIVIFVVGLGVLNWEFWLSFFIAIFAVFAFLETWIVNATGFFRAFTKDFTTVENLWNFFDTNPQIEWYDKWETFIHKQGNISLKNISYWYDESKQVFNKLSLEISGSKITALVWASGGGKSTLVKIIAWYIRQDSWDIFIDDQNLKETSLKSYYSDIWYLTQEPSVFDGSVRENLLYAVTSDISPTSLDETIKLAHCEFIYDLPEWLDTEIWERWVKLSWGQKQRLAIAKIFLKNPKIIILDEPTSALDSISEQKITDAMHNLFKDRTVLVIAHRLQTVKHADDIIVIENGQVKERGTHKELVKLKWFYKQMLDLQSWF